MADANCINIENEEYFLIAGEPEVLTFQGSVVDLALQVGVLEQLTARQLSAVAHGLRDYARKMDVSRT